METEKFFESIEKIKMPVRLVILFGTVILFVGLFVYLVYLPKTDEIRKTKEEITTLNQQIRQAKLKAKDKEKLQAEMAQVDLELKEALKLLPNTKEIPSLLRKVTELGSNSNLDFRTFRPKKEVPREFYVEIPVAIEVRGEYHDVAVFFDRVGHMERIMNIHNVTMKPMTERSTTLITTCDAVTYRFKGNTNEKSADKTK
ncbi:MAG: type 4a pilus biogenesis protein PilO [Deltaproteobacteria bacterium]|nr:type 4a pilus biogenesis protein PilO [Deltaproteobacteria bacterium]